MKKKCCDTSLTIKAAKNLLIEHGLSRTSAKTNILVKLSKSNRPLSVNEIFSKLGEDTCNISTVFRTLTQFKDKGLVQEINLGEDFFRYEIVNLDNSRHHHHHVRCRTCGEIKQLDKCDLSAFDRMISKLGFKDTQHSLEFTGICSNCN